MNTHVPLMLVPDSIANNLAKKLKGLGSRLTKFFPHVKTDLLMTDLNISSEEYLAKSVVNTTFMGGLFGFLIAILFISQGEPINKSIVLGIVISLGIGIMFMVIFARYPDILASKKAESIDKDLVFALKDLSLQISAGVSLYDSFITIANANYEETTLEFKKIIQNVKSGMPMVKALEIMALRTKSDYLKRTAWQIINTLKSGSNLKKTLKRIIKDLSDEQRTKILNYAKELNLWSLLYMLFAVAVPSIGSTMLVILSSFAGFGVTKGLFITFIIICFIIQYVLIGFVKTRRPVSSI